jgi:hypothetical protein
MEMIQRIQSIRSVLDAEKAAMKLPRAHRGAEHDVQMTPRSLVSPS